MSWESSAEYYRFINEAVRDRLGGFHSARCLMFSFDFADVQTLQAKGDWQEAGRVLAGAARAVEAGGADLLILCTNTMHEVADTVQEAVSIPLLHIADPTGERVSADGHAIVGLLATRYTMQRDFYRARLLDRHGLTVLVPDEAGRDAVHEVIYAELVKGVVRDESRARYREVINDLVEGGAEALILGCTEIELLIGEADSPVAIYDTTRLHAEAAVDLALADGA